VLARHLPMERAVGVHLHVAAREHGVEIQSRMFAPLAGVWNLESQAARSHQPRTGMSGITLLIGHSMDRAKST
jgi:hypothetical protein